MLECNVTTSNGFVRSGRVEHPHHAFSEPKRIVGRVLCNVVCNRQSKKSVLKLIQLLISELVETERASLNYCPIPLLAISKHGYEPVDDTRMAKRWTSQELDLSVRFVMLGVNQAKVVHGYSLTHPKFVSHLKRKRKPKFHLLGFLIDNQIEMDETKFKHCKSHMYPNDSYHFKNQARVRNILKNRLNRLKPKLYCVKHHVSNMRNVI